MTTATVGFGAVTIEVTDVADVVITDAELDEESGYYIREIRVFGEALEGTTNMPQVAALRIKSTTKADLDVTAPAQEF